MFFEKASFIFHAIGVFQQSQKFNFLHYFGPFLKKINISVAYTQTKRDTRDTYLWNQNYNIENKQYTIIICME